MKARKLVFAGSVLLAIAGGAGAASAQTDYVGGGQKDRVLGRDLSRDPGGQADPGDPGGSGSERGSLPITGGDILGLTAIGLGAVGTGTVLVRRSRRAGSTA